jgi:hypothetical protein
VDVAVIDQLLARLGKQAAIFTKRDELGKVAMWFMARELDVGLGASRIDREGRPGGCVAGDLLG